MMMMMVLLVLGRVRGTFGLRGGLLVLGCLLLSLRPGLGLFHLLALRTRSQDLAHLEVGVAQGLKGEDRRGTQMVVTVDILLAMFSRTLKMTSDVLRRLGLAYLYSVGSFFGVPLQQVPHQDDGLIAGIWYEGLQRGGHTLGEAEVHGRG